MIVNDGSRARIETVRKLLDRIPDETYVYLIDGPGMQLCSFTQTELRELRALFPGVFWKKSYETWCNTWYYRGHVDGVEIMLTCTEQPPTCTRIVTKKTKVEKVPIAFEEREVEVEEVTFDCSGEAEEAQAS